MKVVTIGLGYIGLPTSALIASHGIKVLGVDIKQDIVDTINRGEVHIVEPDLDEMVKKSVSSGFLQAATIPEPGDVYVIVVPTPFKSGFVPDISFVEHAIDSIIPFLKTNDLIIIESTSPVGTTEKMKDRIYEKRNDLINSVFMAYCPERVLPGKTIEELQSNDRVIGGINSVSSTKAAEFYRKFVNGNLHETDSKSAEMCKLVENASRDNSIAFANSVSLMCYESGIDPYELIKLANYHPRVNILTPGCGVGGHCIAVDPYFLIDGFPSSSKFLREARELNLLKTEWVIDDIKQKVLSRFNVNCNIVIFGLSFKPDIDDMRESPARFIQEKLSLSFSNLMVVEPNIKGDIGDIRNLTIENAISVADVVVFLVAHSEFKGLSISSNIFCLDYCGVTNAK